MYHLNYLAIHNYTKESPLEPADTCYGEMLDVNRRLQTAGLSCSV